MPSKENLVAALQEFNKRKQNEELNRQAKIKELKHVAAEKISEIRGWIPETDGLLVKAGPLVDLGGTPQNSLILKIIDVEIFIFPRIDGDQCSINFKGMFNQSESFEYRDGEWISEDMFSETNAKLTPDMFYEKLIGLIPR